MDGAVNSRGLFGHEVRVFLSAVLVALASSAGAAEPREEISLDARLQALKQEVLEAVVQADLRAAGAESEPSLPELLRLPPPASRLPTDGAETEPQAPSAAAETPAGRLQDAAGLARRTVDRALAQIVPDYGNDPRWRHAGLLLDRGEPFSAARELRTLGSGLGPDDPSATEWSALLARSLLAYGTPAPARAALAAAASAPRSETRRLLPARVALAGFEFRHGEPEAALATLNALPALDHEATLLKAQILATQGQDRLAAKLLAKIQPDPQWLLTAPTPEVQRALLPQYNLGVALLRSGQREAGRTVLDRLGRFETLDKTQVDDDAGGIQALRDKANLALGWQFLREAQGATARPIFERIRLQGPYSNRALLGLGWAVLAPQGRVQNRNDIAVTPESRDTPKFVLKLMQRRKRINCEEFNRLSRAPQELCDEGPRFDQAEVPDDPGRLAERALAPWLELQARDARDVAVRESWTALPHALALLGARPEAQARYESAITRIETERAANAHTLQALRKQGRLVLPTSLLDDLREPSAEPSAQQLFDLLQANGLATLPDPEALSAALSDLRDVLWLQKQASDDDSSIPQSGIGEALTSLRAETEQALKALAIQQLDADQTRLGQYLKAARAGLAALYDPAFAEQQPPEVR